MKKISIILSTVIAVSLLALASCSNVTELNGQEYVDYNPASAYTGNVTVTFTIGSWAKAVLVGEGTGSLPNEIELTVVDPTGFNSETKYSFGTTWEVKVNGAYKLGDKITLKLKDGVQSTPKYSASTSYTGSTS